MFAVPTSERQTQPAAAVVAQRWASRDPASGGACPADGAKQPAQKLGGVEKVCNGIQQGSDRSAVGNSVRKSVHQRRRVVDDGAPIRSVRNADGRGQAVGGCDAAGDLRRRQPVVETAPEGVQRVAVVGGQRRVAILLTTGHPSVSIVWTVVGYRLCGMSPERQWRVGGDRADSNTSGGVSTCNEPSHGRFPAMSQIDAPPENPSGSRYSFSTASTYVVDGVGSAAPPRKIAWVLPESGSFASACADTLCNRGIVALILARPAAAGRSPKPAAWRNGIRAW